MSHSPLARKPRKSLTAFSRAPSQLSRSTSSRELVESPSTHTTHHTSPSPAEQNAFATPPRKRKDSEIQSRLRNSMISTGVGASPISAHLEYSPYLTPPSGPSKSSNLPFDWEANARMAKQAKQAEDDRLRAATDAMPRQKKQRFVRRKALWRRVLESPTDLLDSAIFAIPGSVYEMLPPARWANPIALALYTLHWLMLAPLRAPAIADFNVLRTDRFRSQVDDRWGRFEEEIKPSRRGIVGGRGAFFVTFLWFVLAAANAGYLFTRFRSYDMQLRSAKNPIDSPHASPIPKPSRTIMPSDEDEAPKSHKSITERIARATGHFLVAFTKWTYRSTLSAFGATPPAATTGLRSKGRDDSIQSLQVWDPPNFCLAFFCALPPSAPIISYLLTASNPFTIPLLHAITAGLLSHLAASFQQLVKDKQILNAEVMHEYDERFVFKRLFSERVDRGVGTSDSIMCP